MGVLVRLAGLNVFKVNALGFGPSLNHPADVFRPVIAANDLRLAAPGNDLRENSDHSLGRQREVNFNAQRFTVVVVDHVERECLNFCV